MATLPLLPFGIITATAVMMPKVNKGGSVYMSLKGNADDRRDRHVYAVVMALHSQFQKTVISSVVQSLITVKFTLNAS